MYPLIMKMAIRNSRNMLQWCPIFVDKLNLLLNSFVIQLIYVCLLYGRCIMSR